MHQLAKRIADLERRLTLFERAAAACRIAAMALAAAIVLGLLDYVIRWNDRGLRILATAAFVATALWAAYYWWFRRRRKLNSLIVSRQVESRFPQLRDSLASAIEFLQQDEHDQTAGSAQLRRIVIADVQNTVEGLPLESMVDRRSLRRSAGWLAAALGVLVLLLGLNAGAVSTAAVRLALPFGATEWPRQHHLEFRNAPERLVTGQTFEVELVDTGGRLPDDVVIEYQFADGGKRQRVAESMSRVGNSMVARRENVQGSFSYRAHGGDDNTMPWLHVDVVESPSLSSFLVTIHPPAYSGLAPGPAHQPLEVLEGSGLAVLGTASRPLRGARILREGAEPIAGVLDENSEVTGDRSFQIPREAWIANKSGIYRLELTGVDGAVSVAKTLNLRVLPDPPPTVTWQTPTTDLHVTPAARIPVKLKVEDNLAIQELILEYERSDLSEAERERQPAPFRVELYRGPGQAPQVDKPVSQIAGEDRVVEYVWDITPLALPAGAHLSIAAQASDYRPGIGRATEPRRIEIVTDEELAQRLAERQTQIVRQLERALDVQRTTREIVRGLEIQGLEPAADGKRDSRSIQSAEINQRRVSRTLVDESEGVPSLIAGLIAEIEMNQVEETELLGIMEQLATELQRLKLGALDQADRQLTTVRKSLETSAPQNATGLSQSIAAAGTAQDEVISALEQLIDVFSQKVDQGRLVRLLSELRLDQIAHEESVRVSIDADTRSLRVEELSRAQRTKLDHAVSGQHSLAARYEKIERAMELLGRDEAGAQSDSANSLANGIELARQLDVSMKMQATERDLSDNRIGQALSRETQIVSDLQQLVDALQGKGERPSPTEGLRDAERQLAELRKKTAALRDEAVKQEQSPANADSARQKAIDDRQEGIRKEIEGLAKQLQRMQANDASKSAESAAGRLAKQQPGKQSPKASEQAKQAEEDLERAANQLAQRRQQEDDDIVLEMVRRFQVELAQMVERQRNVIDRTLKVERLRAAGQDDPAINTRVAELAAEERALSGLALEHSEMLSGLAAVRVSLEDAEQRLAFAAKLLEAGKTDLATQAAEQLALARLQAMADTFAQTAAEAAQPPNPPAPPARGAPPNQQPQRRPTFELLEVKMLRMLQTELRDRTQAHEKRLAEFKGQPPEAERVELEREARELAKEQGRLAELVENLLNRNNEDKQ